MKSFDDGSSWLDIIDFPMEGHLCKPRSKGLTMVIDKGIGLVQTTDNLEITANYIDYLKLGFGTSALYNKDVLTKKIDLVRSLNIDIYPGGTFFEVAYLQGKARQYLDFAWHMGFSAIEISDGTVNMERTERDYYIQRAKNIGFKVVTEVGKKDPSDTPTAAILNSQLKSDLDSGADIVIIEGRESGMGVGVYDNKGNIKKNEYGILLRETYESDKIMWEAPLKSQQHELLAIFGPNVNLGNISPNEVLALESLRVGLRGDTLKQIIDKKETAQCVLT